MSTANGRILVNLLESLESQLQSVKEKIEALQSLDKLSFTEEDELSSLQKQNAELERSIALEQERQNLALKQTVDDIESLYTKHGEQYQKNTKTIDDKKAQIDYTTEQIQWFKDGLATKDLSYKQVADYKEVIKGLEEVNEKLKNEIETIESDLINVNTKDLEEWIDTFEQFGLNNLNTNQQQIYKQMQTDLDQMYQYILSEGAYYKIQVQPIFSSGDLEGFDESIIHYFENGGKIENLSSAFSSYLITALQQACENSSIEFAKVIDYLYGQATDNLNPDFLASKLKESFGEFDASSFTPLELKMVYEADTSTIREAKNKVQSDLAKMKGELTHLSSNIKIPSPDYDNYLALEQKFYEDSAKIAELGIQTVLEIQQNPPKPELPAFELSEDHSKLIEDYQSKIKVIKEAIDSLNADSMDSTAITDLIQEFPTYNWDGYISGTKELKEVLKELADQALSNVINKASELSDVLQGVFQDNFGSQYNNILDLEAELDHVLTVLEQVRAGYTMTEQEMAVLINRYPELASEVIKLTNGYSLQEEAVIKVANGLISSTNTMVSEQIRWTTSEIENAKIRLQSIDLQIQKYRELQTAISNFSVNSSKLPYSTGNLLMDRDIKIGMQFMPTPIKESDLYSSKKKEEDYINELYGQLETLRGKQGLFKQPLESSKSKKEKSQKDFENQIDWAAQSVEVLQNKVSRLQAVLEDTNGYNAQIKAIKQVISAQKTLENGYSKAASTYAAQYEKALKATGAGKEVKVLIESGKDFKIEDFVDKNVKSGDTGKREAKYNAIQEAIDWYKKYTDAINNATKVNSEITNNRMKILEINLSKLQAEESIVTEKLNSSTLSYKEQIDLLKIEVTKKKAILQQEIKIAKAKKDVLEIERLNQEIVNEKVEYQLKVLEIHLSKLEAEESIIGEKLNSTTLSYQEQVDLLKEQLAKKKSVLQQEIKIAKAKNDTLEVERLNEELSNTIMQSRYEQFTTLYNGIQAKFSNAQSQFEVRQTNLQKQISIIEAQGQQVGEKYYQNLIKLENETITSLQKEKKELQKTFHEAVQFGRLKVGSDQWYEQLQVLNDLDASILDAKQSVLDFESAIRDLKWDNFDNLLSKFSSLKDESDFLIDLMSDKQLLQDAGEYTDYGRATQTQHAINYDIAMAKAQEYERAAKELANATDAKSLEKKNEYLAAQRESIQAAMQEKSAMINLAKEGIQAQINAFEELIQKKKEALDAEENLYEYQKSIAEKNKDIATIQRQMNALSGDDSLENQKRLRELSSKLQDAQEDLTDTERKHSIDTQKEALDEELKSYKDSMEQYMKNTEAIFSRTLAMVSASNIATGSTIQSVAKSVGYTISTEMSNAWTQATNGITSYTSAVTTQSSGILAVLSSIKTAWLEVANAAEKAAQSNITKLETTTAKNSSATGTNVEEILGTKTNNTTSRGQSQLNQYVTSLGYKMMGNNQILQLADLMGVDGLTESNLWKDSSVGLRSEVLKKLKNYFTNGKFSTGGIVKMATGEDGIAAVKKDETILTDKFTKILPLAVDKMSKLMNFKVPDLSYKMNDMFKTPEFEISSPTTQVTIGDFNFDICVNNPENPKAFLEAIKNDPKLQKAIQEVTIGQMLGRGKYSVNKIR